MTFSLKGSVTLAQASATPMEKIQHLYDRHEYRKVLEAISTFRSDQVSAPDVRRMKIRSLLRLGNPKEALAEYDRLELSLKQEEIPLLREIALGFVLVMVKDMREQMRGVAYTALKEWQSPEAVPFLEDGLSDGSGLVRALAAEGLAKLQEGRRSARFRQAMADQAALVKEAVLKGLGKSGDAAAITLAESALEDSEVRVRVAAAEVLCRFGRARECARLQQSAKALNPDERTSAIRSLVDLQGAEVLPILIEASEHTQPSVRGAAAMGLAHVPRPEALATLARLLKDPLPPVRVAAAVSLGHLRGLDAISALRKSLDDHDASVQAFVVGSLLEQGEQFDEVASFVADLSNRREPGTRAALARALSRASEGNRKAVRSVLESLVSDKIPRVRMAALKAIAKVDGAGAVSILKVGLHDEDDGVRAAAGGALLHALGDKQ